MSIETLIYTGDKPNPRKGLWRVLDLICPRYHKGTGRFVMTTTDGRKMTSVNGHVWTDID